MVLAVVDVLRLERAEEGPAERSRAERWTQHGDAGAPHASLAASMCLQRTAVSTAFAASKNGGQEQ